MFMLYSHYTFLEFIYSENVQVRAPASNRSRGCYRAARDASCCKEACFFFLLDVSFSRRSNNAFCHSSPPMHPAVAICEPARLSLGVFSGDAFCGVHWILEKRFKNSNLSLSSMITSNLNFRSARNAYKTRTRKCRGEMSSQNRETRIWIYRLIHRWD